MVSKPRFYHLFSAAVLSVVAVSVALPNLPAIGAPNQVNTNGKVKLKLVPHKKGAGVRKNVARSSTCVPNTLLIMPNKGDKDEAMDKIREVNGTIVRTIGAGELTTWVVQFEDTEKFLKAEKQLVNDKHFKKMQRDNIFQTQALNDPYYASEWYLNNMKIESAWNTTLGAGQTIGVLDTGVNPKNLDLAGKVLPGYDSVKFIDGKQKDVNGHGTMVSTTAAAIGDNLINTAGPARAASIYPVRASHPKGFFTDTALIEGVYQIGAHNVKLLNLSVNAEPPYSIANVSENQILHDYFIQYHAGTIPGMTPGNGGLIFNAAGNGDMYGNGLFDSNPRLNYLLVVAAIKEDGVYTSFSNWGNCLWFSAPGQNIACSDRKGKGKHVSVNGTSFSSPLACAVAALTWAAHPGWTNDQVRDRMVASTGFGWNVDYGYYVPQANACVAP